MSHTVVRGKPFAAQLYLDDVLDEVLLERGIKPDAVQRERVTITQLLYQCLKRKPNAVFMTNGATGEVITNEELLKRAVSLARALIAAGASGNRVMLLMRNHQHMIVVYFAVLFSGITPFMMDPNTTAYELSHFLNLIEPTYVFYDREHHTILQESLSNIDLKPTTFVVDEPEHLMQFVGGCSDDANSFVVPDALPDDTVTLLPTSGSTGLPKAAALTHRGLVAQLPSAWTDHSKIPTPTGLVMILTSAQWVTFNVMTLTSVVYHIPILISPKINTVESVTEMLEKYRPTWTFFTPAFATNLVPTLRPDQLSSLETVTLLGAPSTPEFFRAFQAKLPNTARLCDGYGTTETHGYIAFPDNDAPFKSNGRVVNTLHYKIVDENGQELGLNQTGELWVKGASVIKKYFKNDSAYLESFTEDGWYKTGDQFYVDENERVTFVVRIKFSFKFNGSQVAPEEVERAVLSVAGVHECCVCCSARGPAAAVVLRPRADVTRELIHSTVHGLLSDHKRLHGGIVFLPSLPYTHTGKVNRKQCSQLVSEAITSGQCF